MDWWRFIRKTRPFLGGWGIRKEVLYRWLSFKLLVSKGNCVDHCLLRSCLHIWAEKKAWESGMLCKSCIALLKILTNQRKSMLCPSSRQKNPKPINKYVSKYRKILSKKATKKGWKQVYQSQGYCGISLPVATVETIGNGPVGNGWCILLDNGSQWAVETSIPFEE